MDRSELSRPGREARCWEDINAADTVENEARLIRRFVAHGMKVRRLAVNAPQRYIIVCADGSVIERASLFDMGRMAAKLDKMRSSTQQPDQRTNV